MTASLLGPGAPEWTEALRPIMHDVYQEPAYVELDARLHGGEAVAFHYTEDGHHLLMPLILRDIPGTGRRDALSPYGYSAPVADTTDAGFWERACAAMTATLGSAGVVTAFVRMHPLLDAPLPVLERFGTLVRHGETVTAELCVSFDEMWRNTRKDHRKRINRARRAGTKVVFNDWNRLPEWVDVYHGNMRRLGAAPYYFFDCRHLTALRDRLGDQVHFAVALEGDEVVGGTVFFEHDSIATGYVASTRRAPGRCADELVYDEVMRYCKAIGAVVFHLGGGKGGANDSLFDYKCGFGTGRHPFHTWRVVTDPVTYRALAGDHPADPAASFPPYR